MRAVNYFIKRFEFAIKNSGTIKLNQNDLDALNQIIDFYNTNYKNTQLEDSLLLFYILQHWKVENKNNEAVLMKVDEGNGSIMKITDSISLLKKICISLEPKKHLYSLIATELWTHQAYNKVPKEKWITEKEVTELLEKELQLAKKEFAFAKELNEGNCVFVYPPNNKPITRIAKIKNLEIAREKLKQISEDLTFATSDEIYEKLCKELLYENNYISQESEFELNKRMKKIEDVYYKKLTKKAAKLLYNKSIMEIEHFLNEDFKLELKIL